jgi:biopolymer transport protein ExbD
MAIYAPGRRDRHNRTLRSRGRTVVAVLSLTAMVDMFTVVAVFLLQNYKTTGEVIQLDEAVALPKAHAVKELRPATVVIVSKDKITLDKVDVASFQQVKEQQDWHIDALTQKLQEKFKELADKHAGLAGQVKDAVDQPGSVTNDPADDHRVTVQADKSIDFLTVKKVMMTLTDAGASEINFAVIRDEDKAQE